MDTALRRQFVALLKVDTEDAAAGLPEWLLYGPVDWFRTAIDWRGYDFEHCGFCGDYRAIATTVPHDDGEGNFIGEEDVQVPCPCCVTGENSVCGVFPNWRHL